MAWTPEEDAQLLEELRTERRYRVIALAHKRTATAIKERAAKLRQFVEQRTSCAGPRLFIPAARRSVTAEQAE